VRGCVDDVTMGRAAIHLPDETKPSDKENEKLLDLEENPSLPDYDDVVAEPQRSSWQRLKDRLPSVKDLIKRVLFPAVIVTGITLVSNSFFDDLWSTVRPPTDPYDISGLLSLP